MRVLVAICIAVLLTTSVRAEDDEKIEVNALVAPLSPNAFVVREDGQRPSVTTLDWPLQVTRTNIVHLKLDADPPVYLARDEALTVDEAIKIYDEKIAELGEAEESADWLVLRGDCHMHAESYDRAATDLLTACRLRPDSQRCALKAACACQLASRYETTLRVCDELLRRTPDSAMGHYWRGRALCGLNDFQGAIAAFDHAILLDPSYADTFSRRSLAYATVGDFSKALQDIDKAIEIEPAPWLFAQAFAYHAARNDTQAAINCLRKGLDVHPASQMLLMAYSFYLIGAGQEHAIEEKYRVNPVVADLLSTYVGMKAIAERRYDEAIAELSTGIERDTSAKPGLMMQRAQAYFECGDQELALADVNWLLEQPEHRTLGLQVRGSFAFRSGNYEAAEIDFAAAIAADPSCLDAHLCLAEICQRRGDFIEGRHWLAKVESQGSDNPAVFLAAAKLELAANNYATAVTKCRHALAAAALAERNASQIVQLGDHGIMFNTFRFSSSSPAKNRFTSTIKALTLRSYAQACQGNYAAALADVWQVCTLPVVPH